MIQFGMAGVVSVLVSVCNDGTARPMIGAIFACALSGAAALVLDRLIPRRG